MADRLRRAWDWLVGLWTCPDEETVEAWEDRQW